MPSIRERISKHCKVVNRNRRGDNIEYGRRVFRMNRLFRNVPDEDLERIFNDKDLGLGDYVREAEKLEETRETTKASRIVAEAKPCECGCGAVARAGRRFLQGHDAKLKSRLRKAAKDGDSAAIKELKARGWF